MVKVLMLTRADHANTGFRFSQCLRSLGLEVECWKAQRHKFDYPVQMMISPVLAGAKRTSVRPTVLKAPGFRYRMELADIIHFHATTFVDTDADLSGKKIVVQHAGSCYQKDPDACNKLFNPIVDVTIVQYPSLMNLGAKNEILVYYPVDTEKIQPYFASIKKDKLVIGHWPSSPERKGTKVILKVIERLKQSNCRNEFEYVGVPDAEKNKHEESWLNNLTRMRMCDVIIERCQIGDGHSEWANTAIEAAALGKIVITNTLSSKLYVKEYGVECPLLIANDEDTLYHMLTSLMIASSSQLYKMRMENRKWVVNNHNMHATANRLWEKVYANLIADKEE